AKKCRRRKVRRRALFPRRGKARCRPWRSKGRCQAAWKWCTESPFVRLDEHWLLDRLAPRALGRFNRLVLHCKIAIATWQAVFVGAAISHGCRNEISMWRRRRRGPLERGRFPWVVVHLFAMLDAPKK